MTDSADTDNMKAEKSGRSIAMPLFKSKHWMCTFTDRRPVPLPLPAQHEIGQGRVMALLQFVRVIGYCGSSLFLASTFVNSQYQTNIVKCINAIMYFNIAILQENEQHMSNNYCLASNHPEYPCSPHSISVTLSFPRISLFMLMLLVLYSNTSASYLIK